MSELRYFAAKRGESVVAMVGKLSCKGLRRLSYLVKTTFGKKHRTFRS